VEVLSGGEPGLDAWRLGLEARQNASAWRLSVLAPCISCSVPGAGHGISSSALLPRLGRPGLGSVLRLGQLQQCL